VKTTWGCWYRCNFCFTWQITDGTPYSRSPESIVDELASIDCEEIYIVDDIFLINRRRLGRIAALMRERGVRKKIFCYGRADFIAENEDVIAEWAELGLTAVLIGLEASTNRELDSMNKQTTVDHNRSPSRCCGATAWTRTVRSSPTRTTRRSDWAQLCSASSTMTGLYYLNMSPLTPLPGTAIWDEYATAYRCRAGRTVCGTCRTPCCRRACRCRVLPRAAAASTRALDARHAAREPAYAAHPPAGLSVAYLRIWWGALRIFLQFRRAAQHHSTRELARAMDRGPAVPSLQQRKPDARRLALPRERTGAAPLAAVPVALTVNIAAAP
jgi:hopanoid C-3 methylase